MIVSVGYWRRRDEGKWGIAWSLLVVGVLAAGWVRAGDQPQFGQAWNRNLVSSETDLPSSFDPATGKNIKWSAKLGTQTHGTPVIANGRVYIGTNNERPRDPKHQGDRGVLMCLDEATGELEWQLVVPKRTEDRYFDWPKSGIASPATVEGNRVYIVSNRGEVMCLDAAGLSDGNDGPYRDEADHMTPGDGAALELGPRDADILWLFNLMTGAGIWSHDAAHSSILIDGPYLYLNSGTGVDNTHQNIRRPEAPSLVVLEKDTGRYVARERENIGPYIFHCTWSAPAMGKVNGRSLIFFAAGNGVVYGFKPLQESPPRSEVATLERVWQFDFDPEAPKKNVHRYFQNRREGPSNFYGMPVFKNDRLFVAGGGDFWWGKNEAWIQCIDPTKKGTITDSGLIWSNRIGRHVMSTPVVHEGLVFIADTSHFVYCFEAAKGELVWRHEAGGPFWASPFVADDKIYLGTRRGGFLVLAADREKEVLSEIDLGEPISATASAANGTLYLTTMRRIFAIE